MYRICRASGDDIGFHQSKCSKKISLDDKFAIEAELAESGIAEIVNDPDVLPKVKLEVIKARLKINYLMSAVNPHHMSAPGAKEEWEKRFTELKATLRDKYLPIVKEQLQSLRKQRAEKREAAGYEVIGDDDMMGDE